MNSAAPRSPAADTGWSVLRWSVVALAIVSRLWGLDSRPPHFDEGVNGWFTDQMRHLGCYQYDPGNYHGPLHFYVLFLFKSLLGRNLWALRLPTAIIGILTVEWCFRFERFLGRRTSVWAAVAMLVSPATLYFQRDAIHEAWLLYFLVLGFWGVCGLCQEGESRYLWTTGLALAGMILTKETWLIHIGCLVLAVPCVFLAELLQPSRRALLQPGDDEPPPLPAHPPDEGDAVERAWQRSWVSVPEPSLFAGRLKGAIAPQRWSALEALAVAGTVVALIVFFYSGNFLLFDPHNYSDKAHAHRLTWFTNIFDAYTPWGKKAGEGEGHSKPFMYWCQLIVRNEPWTLLGLLAAAAYTVPGLPRAWPRWRCIAVAAAVFCVAALVAARGWEHPFVEIKTPTPDLSTGDNAEAAAIMAEAKAKSGAKPVTMSPPRADCLVWWSLGGLVALAGVACLALPTPGAGTLRAYGAAAGAACVGTLFLPWVYPTPVLFSTALIGLAAAAAAMSLPAPGDWRVRLLAIYAVGTLWGYSIIHYKTPWCIISILWPFFFTGAAALSELAENLAARGREAAMFLGAATAAVAACFAVDLNFLRPTDEDFHQRHGENLGLVYVQSFDDVWTVVNPLLAEARADPTFYKANGVILCDSTYPLPWLLGDFESIGYYSNDRRPDDPDGYRGADFLLVTERRVEEAESRLDADYYKQTVRLRPALEDLQFYLRADRFKHLMPAGREPEFHPVPVAPAVPSDLPDIGTTMTPPVTGDSSPAMPTTPEAVPSQPGQ